MATVAELLLDGVWTQTWGLCFGLYSQRSLHSLSPLICGLSTKASDVLEVKGGCAAQRWWSRREKGDVSALSPDPKVGSSAPGLRGPTPGPGRVLRMTHDLCLDRAWPWRHSHILSCCESL